MSDEGLRRPLFLSLACATSIALICGLYFAHQQIDKPPSQTSPTQSLHRSNAIRRPRRRQADTSPETRLWSPPRALESATQTDGADEGYTSLPNVERDSDNNVDQNELDDIDDTSGSQSMLNLMYNIAGEQAKRDGYIHRSVECNGCGACPIQGIRYHCANCFDYDLCETCESNQVHLKSHVFYKIRIPAPQRGQIKQVFPKWYPGNPNAFPQNLPKSTMERLLRGTGMDRTEIGALYDQFKCLAGHEYPDDPCDLGIAIDRKGFDLYFNPTGSDKPQPANLLYDRMYSFYDSNGDGLIGLEEFLLGLSNLQDKSRMAQLRRIFRGYDLDGDGFVCRKDFLRMFRAHYDFSKDHTREMIASQEDFGYLDEEIREVVHGSQPISAAFGGNILFGHRSRAGEDKQVGSNGDLVFANGPYDVLRDDLDLGGDRARAIGNMATGHFIKPVLSRPFHTTPPRDEPLMYIPMSLEPEPRHDDDDATEDQLLGPEPPLQVYGWPPRDMLEPSDITDALGGDVPIDEITDPTDRARVLYSQSLRLDKEEDRMLERMRRDAVQERWRRRQFYLDEEEGLSKPEGYTEPESSDDESDGSEDNKKGHSRRPSLRSRSSSKVRFDDSAIDTDYETRSNASSRSIPQNERWGGYELSHPELDIGRDVLYEAVQQGFNELLDGLFREKEEQAMDAAKTRRDRTKWADVLEEYQEKQEKARAERDEALVDADKLRTEELFVAAEAKADMSQHIPTEETDAIGREEVVSGPQEAVDSASFAELAENSPGPEPESQEGLQRNDGSANDDNAGNPPAETPEYDSTLPQFRPNSPSFDPNNSISKSRGPLPSEETLHLWLKHSDYENQAFIRGGPGRLDFGEFRRKMRSEAEKGDEKAAEEDDTECHAAYWEKSGDLGRMAFVGNWLEMAFF